MVDNRRYNGRRRRPDGLSWVEEVALRAELNEQRALEHEARQARGYLTTAHGSAYPVRTRPSSQDD